jgi:hypothetical protein
LSGLPEFSQQPSLTTCSVVVIGPGTWRAFFMRLGAGLSGNSLLAYRGIDNFPGSRALGAVKISKNI